MKTVEQRKIEKLEEIIVYLKAVTISHSPDDKYEEKLISELAELNKQGTELPSVESKGLAYKHNIGSTTDFKVQPEEESKEERIVGVNYFAEDMLKEEAEGGYVKCNICNGTGVNHYDDNNPCPECKGDGVVKQSQGEEKNTDGLLTSLKISDMSKCIPFKIGSGYGFLCLSETDFNCPVCGYKYTEDDYYKQLNKSEYGIIYKKCKGCKTKLGITTDIRGDIRVWLKSEELGIKTVLTNK